MSGANTFDNADRVLTMTYAKGASTLSKYTYTHTSGGLLATATPSSGAPGTASTYALNPFEQLQSTAGSGSTAKWTYDLGNRTTANPAGSTFTDDVADELVKQTPATGSATTFGYDNRGDLHSLTVGTSAPAYYTYDQGQDLTQVVAASGPTWNYTYDGDGR